MIALQGSDAQLRMIRDGNGKRGILDPLLHHYMATASADFAEALFGENSADLFAGKQSQPNQLQPPAA